MIKDETKKNQFKLTWLTNYLRNKIRIILLNKSGKNHKAEHPIT